MMGEFNKMGQKKEICIDIDPNSVGFQRLKEIITETFGKEIELKVDYCKLQKSKRNLVFSVQIPNRNENVVVKIFNIPERSSGLQNELKIYSELNKTSFVIKKLEVTERKPEEKVSYTQFLFSEFAIPKMIAHGNDFIVSEFISGNNIMDLIEENVKSIPDSSPYWKKLFTGLILWVIYFYTKFGYFPGDNHIRNFISVENKLYGLDFEDLLVEKDSLKGLIDVLATIFFSVLGAYPGIMEGEFLDYKKNLGIIFIQSILSLKDDFPEILGQIERDSIIRQFLNSLEKEGKAVIRRRKQFHRGGKFKPKTVEKYLENTVRLIQNSFQ